MMDIPLTEDNWKLFSIRTYRNPQCLGKEEFEEDVNRFTYLKKLLRKYRLSREGNVRLILNHVISIYNVFPIAAANKLAFFRTHRDEWPQLKTLLIFLAYLPEDMYSDVTVDLHLANELKNI